MYNALDLTIGANVAGTYFSDFKQYDLKQPFAVKAVRKFELTSSQVSSISLARVLALSVLHGLI